MNSNKVVQEIFEKCGKTIIENNKFQIIIPIPEYLKNSLIKKILNPNRNVKNTPFENLLLN